MATRETAAYQVRLSESFLGDIDEMVYELSEPMQKVNRSEVIRAAFRDYDEKHRANLQECRPEIHGQPGEQPRKAVSAKFTQSEAERLERVSYELSSPDHDVTASDVLRAALRDYYEKYRGDLRVCDPISEGTLVPGDR